jgi:hypothetical protein
MKTTRHTAICLNFFAIIVLHFGSSVRKIFAGDVTENLLLAIYAAKLTRRSMKRQ